LFPAVPVTRRRYEKRELHTCPSGPPASSRQTSPCQPRCGGRAVRLSTDHDVGLIRARMGPTIRGSSGQIRVPLRGGSTEKQEKQKKEKQHTQRKKKKTPWMPGARPERAKAVLRPAPLSSPNGLAQAPGVWAAPCRNRGAGPGPYKSLAESFRRAPFCRGFPSPTSCESPARRRGRAIRWGHLGARRTGLRVLPGLSVDACDSEASTDAHGFVRPPLPSPISSARIGFIHAATGTNQRCRGTCDRATGVSPPHLGGEGVCLRDMALLQ